MSAATPSTAQIAIFVTVIPRRPWPFEANETFERPWRGKSSIKRSAIAPESGGAHCPPGNCAINAANLCLAVPSGSSDNSAASFHGSRFSRVSAERTLSGISFLSAPIGAYRKSLNSDLKKETEMAGVTMTTKYRSTRVYLGPLPWFLSGPSVLWGLLLATQNQRPRP